LRTGIHLGRPRKIGGDYLGIDVNIAARLAEAADPDEILVSGRTLESVGGGHLLARKRRFSAPGAPAELRVYAVRRAGRAHPCGGAATPLGRRPGTPMRRSAAGSPGPASGRPHEILQPMVQLGTILTAIVTPFKADGSVNEDSFVALMRHLGENGSDGFLVAGTTGEASTLTDEGELAPV